MNSRGFTLLEVIAAIGIIGIGVGAAFVLIQRTLTFSSTVAYRTTASYLAQEGAEIARNIRDANLLSIHKGGGGVWSDGLTSCSAGCEADYGDTVLASYQGLPLKRGTSFFNYDTGSDTPFRRKITLTPVSADQVDVAVEVTWSDRGRSGSVTVASQMYNWLNP
jgi:prepilin-type N-terminal cleavage/methylation domain-containing protein